ncbi:FGGY-family carbohydrate kinase [Thermovenabulum gondwanense]|uniref:Glycerol kinase n=1 Tax=Thermovenabulum gondwanense TaxID=520767 RepID=A0A162MPW7_9FIRM|nr:FGGY-family carbohydrate kinase [Thermovenabulum gondwanense]KYO66910.1 Glycerol kinase [Thermovenabulum gondwanense]
MHYIVSIDVGTSSLRGIIFDQKGRMIFSSKQEYCPEYNKHLNYVEQNPDTWQKALIFVLEEVSHFIKDNGLEISAIAVASQRASVIPVDKECMPLFNAIMWQDKRSLKVCDKIEKITGKEELYKRTGLRLDPYFSLPKMIWIKEEMPEIYKNTYKLIGVQDFIIYQLTKKYITDWTQASRTMLMDIRKFTWDEEILRISGLKESILPELCPPGSIVGNLTDEISNLTGLEAGIPVIIAGGDQQCAAVALNVIKDGFAEANTGTGSFVIAYSEEPVFDEKIRTLCSAAAVPGKWIAEAGMFTTGAIYRWFKEQLCEFNKDNQEIFEAINEEIENTPVGSNGIIILPHFEGSAAPYWNPLAKGVIFNLTLGTKRGDIARAILEGICTEIAKNILLIENIKGKIHTISVAGGLTKFKLFNQMQADSFNKRVIKYPESEASSLGAAIIAFTALGIYKDYEEAFSNMVTEDPVVYEPIEDNVKLYREIMNKKERLYYALLEKGLYNL